MTLRLLKSHLLVPGDLVHLAGLIGGAGLAAVLPHAADRRVTAGLNWLWGRLRRSEIDQTAEAISRTLPERFDREAARGLAEAWMARRAEVYWGRKRGLFPSDWRIELELEGAERLERARANGRGAVLWFGSFCDSSLMMRALAETGLPLAHLSMAAHGAPSGTRFGMATIGRLHRRGEDRYLRERVVILRRKRPEYMKRLRALLAANHLVTIRGDLMSDSRNSAPCLGKRVKVAAGAPTVAFQAKAPLLPVFVERAAPMRYRVRVEEAITGPEDDKRAFVAEAVEEFGRRLDRRLAQGPADWDGWGAVEGLIREPFAVISEP